MSVIPDALFHRGGVPVDSLSGWDAGNVYWVIDSDHTQYAKFIRDRQGAYENDKSEIVHSTIQSALNATVTNRNDYVIVVPVAPGSTYYYDLTAALTMTKNNVHLISPSNFGSNGFGVKSPIINTLGQTVAVITLTGDGCEIAGLFFRGAQGYDIIDVESGTQGLNVHDNFFGMSATGSSANYGIDASVLYYFNISNNYFTNWNPGAISSTDNDIPAFIYISSNASCRGVIKGNYLSTGHNTAVAIGIDVEGTDVLIADNILWETTALAASEAGTFTIGINAGAQPTGLITGNRIGITDTSNAITGSTAVNCINNYSSLEGGTIVS